MSERTPTQSVEKISQKLPEQQVEKVLKNFLAAFATISDAEFQEIVKLLNIQQFEAGTVLLREGQICNKCYFVLEGCLRQYYLVDGVEKTTHFFTEGQPVISTNTFDFQPSKFWLTCTESSTLIVGTPENEVEFMQKMPHFEMINRIGVERELKKSSETLAEFMIRSPEERYRQLLDTRPDLLDRVPQYQLASYLGVTPESLSRIRRRIAMSATKK